MPEARCEATSETVCEELLLVPAFPEQPGTEGERDTDRDRDRVRDRETEIKTEREKRDGVERQTKH